MVPDAERSDGVSGVVHQVSVSAGGVPKSSIESGYVGPLGLLDDGHNDSFHGGPDKALCLYSLEVIEAIASEGHSLVPGAAGENVTVRGIDWSQVSPGTRWSIGDEVEIEVTHFTTPCSKNSRWFADGDFSRMNQQIHPGNSRVYARVLTEGVIRPGDQFAPAG
jgi:MOSC domain-containing protein YiiM